MNRVGETLQVWGCVRSKQQAGAYGLVTVETGVLNELGVESTPGTAVVALPLRGGPPVPYPFTAPVD